MWHLYVMLSDISCSCFIIISEFLLLSIRVSLKECQNTCSKERFSSPWGIVSWTGSSNFFLQLIFLLHCFDPTILLLLLSSLFTSSFLIRLIDLCPNGTTVELIEMNMWQWLNKNLDWHVKDAKDLHNWPWTANKSDISSSYCSCYIPDCLQVLCFLLLFLYCILLCFVCICCCICNGFNFVCSCVAIVGVFELSCVLVLLFP